MPYLDENINATAISSVQSSLVSRLKYRLLARISYRSMSQARNLACWALYYSGMGWSLGRKRRKGAAILLFHSVGGEGVFPDNVCSIERFRAHLRHLQRTRTVVALSDILHRLETQRSIPDDWVAITLDDGYRDNLSLAAPILAEFGFPATVFVPTAVLDSDFELFPDAVARILSRSTKEAVHVESMSKVFPLKSKSQREEATLRIVLHIRDRRPKERDDFIADLAQLCSVRPIQDSVAPIYLSEEELKGAEPHLSFGAHTHSHPNLAALDDQALTAEIETPKRTLESALGVEVADFAYSFGKTWSYNDKVRGALAKTGYRSALTTIPGFVTLSVDPLAIPRIGVDNSLSRLKLNLLGVFV